MLFSYAEFLVQSHTSLKFEAALPFWSRGDGCILRDFGLAESLPLNDPEIYDFHFNSISPKFHPNSVISRQNRISST